MSKYAQPARNIGQSPISFSINALEEIVRNCQRNEERLHELERHTRHERKKAERLLHETYRAMQNGDSQNTSNILENSTNNDHSYRDNQKSKSRSSKQFYVSLDDENEENENHYRQQSNNNNNNNNNNEIVKQNKHLLERVEKLLAGDGTTTSSDIMSSQERQKNITEKPTSPIEDDLDEKSLNIIDHKNFSESRPLQSACSIEYDLSTVDHLLSERTPINNHRIKSNVQFNEEDQSKKISDYNNEKKILPDKHDQQFYERYNNYIETDRSVSSRIEKQPTTTDDETYQYESRPMSRINNKDEELADLARRCEDLLARLHSQRNRAAMLENSTHHYDYHQQQTSPHSSTYESKQNYHHHQSISSTPPPVAPSPISLQQALELLRPEFISRSRQRVRRVRLLREERERNAEIDRERRQMLLFSCTTCCSNPAKRSVSAPSSRRNISYIVPFEQSDYSRIPSTYHQMKKATKKKYDQLPEVSDRRRQHQMDEIRRQNLLRAKLFRARLRQHVARHGRTNIDESLTIIDA
ncbi:unnamed protein product [Rotaria sp. Silwood1]|nr:unnamed protein product [Rotaria sp. Silwood1]CAF1156147.1 unnamed protein product [Rotaria sp. Silwood1]CAF4974231.1 unnamed protein product [Rotaria sp. Silwood1]